MLEAAARQHIVKPITVKRFEKESYTKLFGQSAGSVASTYGLKLSAVRRMKGVLKLLLAISEQNGSSTIEVFDRFQDYGLAMKRTRNAFRKQNEKAREEDEVKQRALLASHSRSFKAVFSVG